MLLISPTTQLLQTGQMGLSQTPEYPQCLAKLAHSRHPINTFKSKRQHFQNHTRNSSHDLVVLQGRPVLRLRVSSSTTWHSPEFPLGTDFLGYPPPCSNHQCRMPGLLPQQPSSFLKETPTCRTIFPLAALGLVPFLRSGEIWDILCLLTDTLILGEWWCPGDKME